MPKLNNLAKLVNAEIVGDANVEINSVATITSAGKGQITFLTNKKYRHYLESTNADAVIISANDLNHCKTNALVVKNPHYAYAIIAEKFEKKTPNRSGIHASAVIGKNCHIDNSVYIGPNVVVGDNVIIDKNSQIEANCVVQTNVKIGENCFFWPNVTLYHDVEIKNFVTIHSGTVIGSDGFGFAKENGKWHKVPQLGKVIVEDHVDIGANVAIDRGAIEDTIIEEGVKLDNLIQVGHNVKIGAYTVIAGKVGIAGSTTIGKNCMIGGGVGINGHIEITDNVFITGESVVYESIIEPGTYSSGFAAKPGRTWFRILNYVYNIGDIVKRIAKLEKEISHE